jgi:2',3'-cyclic-nucleotide 2'-phosphodiesterase (5'-nucleotidase family)
MLFLSISCNQQAIEFTLQGHTLLVDSINAPEIDKLQHELIEQFSQDLKKDMDRILVYSEQVLEKGTPEGTLNNFVADLVLEKGKQLYTPSDGKPIDFCLLNYGGLRVPLPKGEITYSRVFELLPFENEMVVVTLSGEKTLELFQYLANATVGMPVSGVRLRILKNTPQSILIRNHEFDITRSYKVLTSDYLAEGGDAMTFFRQPINYELLGMRVRDAIIDHMVELHASGNKINAVLDQRISIQN